MRVGRRREEKRRRQRFSELAREENEQDNLTGLTALDVGVRVASVWGGRPLGRWADAAVRAFVVSSRACLPTSASGRVRWRWMQSGGCCPPRGHGARKHSGVLLLAEVDDYPAGEAAIHPGGHSSKQPKPPGRNFTTRQKNESKKSTQDCIITNN